MNENNIMITVFTPTYNRGYCLNRAYQSLIRQTCQEFTWLIIDDGSTDNTKDLVASWQQEGKIPIRYIYKENGGMHSAHNTAHAHIDTELCICLDSDDMLTDDCIESVLVFWEKNKAYHSQVAGIIAEDGYISGGVIGSHLPDDMLMASEDYLREVMGIKGDKKIIFKSECANMVPPYPEFYGEKFGSMAFKRRLIEVELGLKWLVMPRIVYLVEYMADGATKNMYNLYTHSFHGWDIERRHAMQYSLTFKRRFLSAIHYVSNSIFLRKKRFISDSPRKILTIAAIPFGVALNLLIRFKTRKHS